MGQESLGQEKEKSTHFDGVKRSVSYYDEMIQSTIRTRAEVIPTRSITPSRTIPHLGRMMRCSERV